MRLAWTWEDGERSVLPLIIMVYKPNGKQNVSPQRSLCPGRSTSRPNSTVLRYIKLLPLCVCVCVCVACRSPTSPCSVNVITRCSVSKPHGPVVMQYPVPAEWAPYSTSFWAVVMQSYALNGSAIEPMLRGCVFNPFTHLSVSISLGLKRCLIWLMTYVTELKKRTHIYLWLLFRFNSFLQLSFLRGHFKSYAGRIGVPTWK